MDYQKNLPMPNISTSEIYNRRQLSFHSFNIHLLGVNDVWFYTYDELVARKGSDHVASILANFFDTLEADVRELDIFWDSCCGQNKNYTIFRLLHYMVHVANRYDSMTVTFLVRSHSYMECDRDMSLMNQKSRCELADDRNKVFPEARERPSPYKVFQCTQELFRNYTRFLHDQHKPKCPVGIRDIRVSKVCKPPPLLYSRASYHGLTSSVVICKPQPKAARSRKKEGHSWTWWLFGQTESPVLGKVAN